MKHTVHVTVTYSVEVEASSQTKAKLIATDMLETDMSEFDREVTVFESYVDGTKRPVKGRGSY